MLKHIFVLKDACVEICSEVKTCFILVRYLFSVFCCGCFRNVATEIITVVTKTEVQKIGNSP